jgi:hypothetical protein
MSASVFREAGVTKALGVYSVTWGPVFGQYRPRLLILSIDLINATPFIFYKSSSINCFILPIVHVLKVKRVPL